MTDDTTDTKRIEVELDAARAVMYEELKEEFGQALIVGDVTEAVKQRMTGLYDNRDAMREAVEEELDAEIQDVE